MFPTRLEHAFLSLILHRQGDSLARGSVGVDQGEHIQAAQGPNVYVSDTTRYSCARLARRFFWCTSSPDPTGL